MLDLTMQTELATLDSSAQLYRGRDGDFTMTHLRLQNSRVRITFDCWRPDELVALAATALAAAADLAEANGDAAASEIARRWQDVEDFAAWADAARTNDEVPS